MKKVLLYLENSFPDESHERALSVGPGLIGIKSGAPSEISILAMEEDERKKSMR
jgi:hypothetical protein